MTPSRPLASANSRLNVLAHQRMHKIGGNLRHGQQHKNPLRQSWVWHLKIWLIHDKLGVK